MPRPWICTPPKEYKDWNEAHVAGADLDEHFENNCVQLSDLKLASLAENRTWD